jgi:hypothetical protein
MRATGAAPQSVCPGSPVPQGREDRPQHWRLPRDPGEQSGRLSPIDWCVCVKGGLETWANVLKSYPITVNKGIAEQLAKSEHVKDSRAFLPRWRRNPLRSIRKGKPMRKL